MQIPGDFRGRLSSTERSFNLKRVSICVARHNIKLRKLKYRDDPVYTNFCSMKVSLSEHLFTRKSSLPRFYRRIYRIPVDVQY